MDIGLEGAAPTLACFSDGSHAVYMSNGGGPLALDSTASEAQDLARQFVASVAALATYIPVTDDVAYPALDVVRFSLRRGMELRAISFTWEQLLAPQNPFAQVFRQGETLMKMAIAATPAARDLAPPPGDLIPEASSPEPAGDYLTAPVDIRRRVLTGVDDNGNRADLGAVALTMADLGVPGGCVSVACFTDGLTSVYMSYGPDILGLAGASPEIDALASAFVESLLAIAPNLPETDDFDYPELNVARFYVRTPEGARGISLPADMLDDARNAFTQAFVTANKIFEEATRIVLEVPSFDARVKPAR